MSQAHAAKGWCPGALRPMLSADGLVVRVRPRLARLGAAQVLGLCACAGRFGDGGIEMTRRANLQLHGVAAADHPALLADLGALGLLDDDPALEGRRNVLVTPFWVAGDRTWRIARALDAALAGLPDLPAKFGFAVDTGPAPLLAGDPADIRIETAADGGMIVRADGAAAGWRVAEAGVVAAVRELAAWFHRHRSAERRRMAQVAAAVPLPAGPPLAPPAAAAPRPVPGGMAAGRLLGAAFGRIEADQLAGLVRRSGATAMRATPWRLFLLEGAGATAATGFIADPDDPLLRVDACRGAPNCASASVATRALARALAGRVAGHLHVSGCSKGCARSRPAEVTLVGRDGRFDLVEPGCAWDEPRQTGLAPDQIMSEFG